MNNRRVSNTQFQVFFFMFLILFLSVFLLSISLTKHPLDDEPINHIDYERRSFEKKHYSIPIVNDRYIINENY